MRIRDRQQTLFPDITFTCNGSITKWIVGAETGDGDLQTELQVWRNIGGTSYTKVGFSLLPSGIFSGIVEHIPNPLLEFQEGDILGVYQPRGLDSALVVYYQERDGPVNYQEGNSSQSDVTLGSSVNQFDYPLVTVEISTLGMVLTMLVGVYKLQLGQCTCIFMLGGSF